VFLIDTNVVSELRNPRPHQGVLAWLENARDQDLHLSALTLGELQAEVEIARGQDPAKAEEIEAWIDRVAESWSVLPLDAAVCRCWARLMHKRQDDLLQDAMIAATALVHGLTVVTRNLRDFNMFGVPVLDPFQAVLG
jgi:predicted nucleic acid-binding protein